MEQKSHILITGFAAKCLENGLYGVSRKKINLISNININDIVYIYDKKDMKIHGPFTVKKDIYLDYNFIWEYEESKKETKKDKYPYRIFFDFEEFYYTNDSSILWELYWNKNDNLLPISTSNKSVITLFPEDSKLLLEKIKSKDNLFKYDKPILKNPDFDPFDFFKNRTPTEIEDSYEAELEYYILKNQKKFIEFLDKKCNIDIDENAILYNQVTLPVHNFTMDLFIVNDIKENVIIIELKQKQIDENTIKQLRLYSKYFKDHKNITLIAIGSEFYVGDCTDTFQIKYKITKDKKVKLTSTNGEELVF